MSWKPRLLAFPFFFYCLLGRCHYRFVFIFLLLASPGNSPLTFVYFCTRVIRVYYFFVRDLNAHTTHFFVCTETRKPFLYIRTKHDLTLNIKIIIPLYCCTATPVHLFIWPTVNFLYNTTRCYYKNLKKIYNKCLIIFHNTHHPNCQYKPVTLAFPIPHITTITLLSNTSFYLLRQKPCLVDDLILWEHLFLV